MPQPVSCCNAFPVGILDRGASLRIQVALAGAPICSGSCEHSMPLSRCHSVRYFRLVSWVLRGQGCNRGESSRFHGQGLDPLAQAHTFGCKTRRVLVLERQHGPGTVRIPSSGGPSISSNRSRGRSHIFGRIARLDSRGVCRRLAPSWVDHLLRGANAWSSTHGHGVAYRNQGLCKATCYEFSKYRWHLESAQFQAGAQG
jgi:hypothetical protein